MLKRFLSYSAVLAFLLSACTSDNSTSVGGVSEDAESNQKDVVLHDTVRVNSLENSNSGNPVLDIPSSSGSSLDKNDSVSTEYSSSSSVNPPSDSKKATCEVTEKDASHITIYVVQPDSGSITMVSSYQDALYRTLVVFELDPSAPRESFDEACNEMKGDTDVTKIVCEDRKITATMDQTIAINPIPFIESEIVDYCNTIQATGVIPEEDD